jgi:RNA polymerase sigma factor (sigma-70 family)
MRAEAISGLLLEVSPAVHGRYLDDEYRPIWVRDPTFRLSRGVISSVDVALGADLVKRAPKRFAAATPQEFGSEVTPYLGKMANLAARLADGADRDDVVQEALMRAWVKRSDFDPARGSLSGWLLAITADQARKARRRSLRRALPNYAPLPVDSPDQRLDLDAAIQQLSPRQRLAVECVYFAGLTVVETAAAMRCSEGTVKSTLADARNTLRVRLGKR